MKFSRALQNRLKRGLVDRSAEKTGSDMTSPEAILAVIAKMNNSLGEMGKTLSE